MLAAFRLALCRHYKNSSGEEFRVSSIHKGVAIMNTLVTAFPFLFVFAPFIVMALIILFAGNPHS
jgi:hypothetical protein